MQRADLSRRAQKLTPKKGARARHSTFSTLDDLRHLRHLETGRRARQGLKVTP